ncbi:MAG: patatin-like phospholipase family protein, partial [Mucinivorans sp.]
MKRFFGIIFFIAIIGSVQAQKVGLVLSGGGAKGLYHVGIIKALEENGIPIDYVSGASMGAIVGAM